ncbi:hypothetical protein J6590_042058 [Homalodisca vitripennis]|nr:hypothetical protein J6590_042058 [Homalodisca vitripennis]
MSYCSGLISFCAKGLVGLGRRCVLIYLPSSTLAGLIIPLIYPIVYGTDKPRFLYRVRYLTFRWVATLEQSPFHSSIGVFTTEGETKPGISWRKVRPKSTLLLHVWRAISAQTILFCLQDRSNQRPPFSFHLAPCPSILSQHSVRVDHFTVLSSSSYIKPQPLT